MYLSFSSFILLNYPIFQLKSIFFPFLADRQSHSSKLGESLLLLLLLQQQFQSQWRSSTFLNKQIEMERNNKNLCPIDRGGGGIPAESLPKKEWLPLATIVVLPKLKLSPIQFNHTHTHTARNCKKTTKSKSTEQTGAREKNSNFFRFTCLVFAVLAC